MDILTVNLEGHLGENKALVFHMVGELAEHPPQIWANI